MPISSGLKGKNLYGCEAGWQSIDNATIGGFLSELDKYYDDPEISIKNFLISDLWSKPRSFEKQLFNDVISEDCEREWRAVLAIIGLHAIRRINLKAISIKVPQKVAAYEHPFLRAISLMMDAELSEYFEKEIVDGIYYNVINIITCNYRPIALIWPNSIIYPVPGIRISGPWCDDNGEYCDPTKLGRLNRPLYLVLAKWLYDLTVTVVQHHNGIMADYSEYNDKYYDARVKLLKKYIVDLLKVYIGRDDLDETVINSLNGYNINNLFAGLSATFQRSNGFDMKGYAGELLNQVYKLQAPTNPTKIISDVRLDSISGNQRVLVISEAIADQWEVAADQINCFNYCFLDNMLEIFSDTGIESKIQKKRFIEENNLSNLNTEIWTEENFFTDKILVITHFPNWPDATPLPNSLTETDENVKRKFISNFSKVNLQEFILPIKHEVLKFIPIKDLLENIDIQRETRYGDIIVSLRIVLSGHNAARRIVTLTKVYSYEDIMTVSSSHLPNVQIWPNFEHADWKKYYVFTGEKTESKYQLKISPVWDDAVKDDLNVNIKTWEELSVNLRSGTEFPKVFVCSVPNNFGIKSIEVGLICLDDRKLDSIQPNNGMCCIGVDFGTTNTTVSYAPIGFICRPMTFEDRIFSVTRLTEERKDYLKRYFFPASSQPEAVKGASMNSIFTIFHSFILEDEKQVENKEQPLARGNIYYLESDRHISDDKVVIYELKGNIKWDKGAADTNRMKAFLLQLCLQAMAEAFAKGFTGIIWQYSWPSVFKRSERKFYDYFWTGDLIEAMNKVSVMSNSNNVYQKTENEAMVDYCQNVISNKGLLSISHGLLTIDIGGGNTNISVWDFTGLLHQCSFRMAGTDIFSNYIKTKYRKVPDLLTPLGNGNQVLRNKFERLTKLAEEAREKPVLWKTFELELESILKYSEKDLIQGMSVAEFSGREFRNLNIVMRDIAFVLGGIFYYAGSAIGYLRNKGQKYDGTDISENSPIHTVLPDFFICGNGSKLLDWAAKGNFDNDKKVNNFLRICIVYGMLDSMKITFTELNDFDIKNSSIIRSKMPKSEVSMGLACRLGHHNVKAIDDYDNSVISGELLFLGNDNVSSEDMMISKENFTDKRKFITVDNDCDNNKFIRYWRLFNSIIQRLNLFDHRRIEFAKADLDDIFLDLDNELKKMRKSNDKDIIVGPIFIMELRKTMKLLSTM